MAAVLSIIVVAIMIYGVSAANSSYLRLRSALDGLQDGPQYFL